MKGIGVSPGVAIGKAVVLDDRRASVFYVPIGEADVPAELTRLEAAVEAAKVQLTSLRSKVQKEIGAEHAAIIDAHLLMLDDEMLVGKVRSTIVSDHVNAEWALKVVTSALRRRFRDMDDTVFQERGRDVEDVGDRPRTIC